jgi:ABC-type amino acid transport substrate-binding protein
MNEQLLEILSPIDRQEFQKSREVTLQGKLTVGSDAMETLCWKLVNDPGCFGFSADQATAVAARTALASSENYHGCSALPVEVKGHVAAGCWILQFDLMDRQKVILENHFRSIHVVTIDEKVEEYYPNLPRLQGGIVGMLKHAIQNRGRA